VLIRADCIDTTQRPSISHRSGKQVLLTEEEEAKSDGKGKGEENILGKRSKRLAGRREGSLGGVVWVEGGGEMG
jgi:hypothetical protein